ncbi:MFS transporter [Glaciimonas soli]|nr:MFS transporter [Glaciimonas soli]
MNTTASNYSLQNMTGYAAYGLLGMPLAMSALPVYVQVPAYYTTQLGLTLTSTGWVLFLARLIDTFQDPLLGLWIDRLRGGLHRWLIVAAIGLSAAFLGLWLPLVATSYLALWLGLMLILTYTAHSMINIAYLSWGAKLQPIKKNNASMLLGAAAWREGAGLMGVIIASVIPSIIMLKPREQIAAAMGWYSLAFAGLLMLAMIALLYGSPKWQRTATAHTHGHAAWSVLTGNLAFRRLLAPYFLNAISVAIPATLVLFFIRDRLQVPNQTGLFLAVYFIAAAIGLPMWVALAKRFGVARCWGLGMLLAILAFFSAALLTAGDSEKYLAVCIAAGLALGADLALPPVLLAQVIAADEAAAAYYGIWTLLGKLALALSGLALPFLAYFGYQPGQAGGAVLGWTYAAVPCACKFIALLLLIASHRSFSKTTK